MSELLILGAVGVCGFLCQWLAWRTKQPAIMYLLVCGILVGPVFHVVNPDQLFGDLLFPLVSLAVAIILFEGSLTLKRKEIKDIGPVVWRLVTIGALINAVIVTLATRYLVGLEWSLCALFGAVMVVTGPTVIVPLLRAVRPNTRISRTLRWEGIIIDPLGALFAVLVFEWIVAQQSNSELLHVSIVFFKTIGIGTTLGLLFAYGFGLLLRHHWIPEYLHNYAAIAFVTASFVLSDTLMHESGLLAVTVMGIALANMKNVHTRGILEFKESLTLIFVAALFILLAARIDFAAFAQLGWGALGILLVMQFIARPVKVWFSTRGSNLTFNEKVFLSWLGPRGIVAAAVTALFAIKLENVGFAQAELLVPLAFSIIIGTVFIQSLTAKTLAKWLGIRQSSTTGYLIIGANPVALAIAKALDGAGSKVLVCDIYWDNISAARMAGLQTYYGNPLSDHAEIHLELSELGGMIGLSHHHERNLAAALRFKEDFGARQIYILATPDESGDNRKKRTTELNSGRLLFGKTVSFSKLASMLSRGATIKKTTFSEEYGYENWLERNPEGQTIPLFAIDARGKLNWAIDQEPLAPKSGWTLFSICEESANSVPQSPDKNSASFIESAATPSRPKV